MIMDTFFITGASGWILRFISDDITRELSRRGYNVRTGNYEDYGGETVTFQMWWRLAKPFKGAKHNSVFVTHTDDKSKEQDLIRIKDQFDSFVCMSEEDACFLIEIGFDPKKVYGRTLPIRNTYIRPLSVGIFSNCYPDDHRKNELWLLEYCQKHKNAQLLNYVFIGAGWEKVCNELAAMNCSFEWHCVSRELPYEYMFQQLQLSNLDYYLYMGMDGGAMGTYDAYAMGTPLCVSDDGYHKSIPDLDRKFETKEEMFIQLEEIASKQRRKLDFFEANKIDSYVEYLLQVWQGFSPVIAPLSIEKPQNFESISEKRMANYFPLTFERWRQPFFSAVHKLFLGRNVK